MRPGKIMITMMPTKEPHLTVYVHFDWPDEAFPFWMKVRLKGEYPAIIFAPGEKEDEHAREISSDTVELKLTHPMYIAPALYERLGWVKYMSYRMEVGPSPNGDYIFNLKNAVPYAVDDFIESEELERLRKTLSPMELTKLFLPGAKEPYAL